MTPKPRAVLYVRLSRDSAVSTSIAGQNADLYALAEREGWQIVATFEDTGKSGGKERANASAALDMLRENEADVLAVYAYDRWSRMGIADSAELIKAIYQRQQAARANRAPAPLFVAAREGIRSDQEGWEIRVAFAADVAQKERDRMVARRKGAIERMRREGRNPGNGPAPFGYRSAPFDDGRPGRRFVVDPTEAEVIREVADRLVAGESVVAVSKDLNERAIPMPRSAHRLAALRGEPTDGLATGTWTSSRVAQLWTSEHLLGRLTERTQHVERSLDEYDTTTREDRDRLRYGEPVKDPRTGLPLQAFAPILDIETMLAIRERFQRNRGRGNQRKRRAARLLSGLAFCGACGSPMYVLTSGSYSYYRCSGPSRNNGCTGRRIKAETLEDFVTGYYLRAFGNMRAVSITEQRGAPEVDEEIALLTAELSAIGRQLVDEDADVPALLQRRQVLLERRTVLREAAPTSRIVRNDLGKTWGEAFAQTDSIDVQRGYLLNAIDHVEVFLVSDPERVRVFLNS